MKKADLLAVDMFCGAGGASTGLVRACDALGIKLWLLAINHWPTAVQTHLLNHPGVQHKCEAIERIDPRAEVPGGRLNLLLAGPECTHHSNAAGGRPKNEQSRASAWHIAKWAQELYIDTILIENVPEFRNWGPLGVDQKPLKSRKGETFKAFIKVLESLGYVVEVKVLNAADYGDPTTRQRLFLLARRGKLAHSLNWPIATHSKHGQSTLFTTAKRWKPARDIIDWSLPGTSIFNRKRPLKPATIKRIIAGLDKFGGPELKPFLVVLRNNADGKSIKQPVPTVAAEGNHIGLAQPFMVPMYGERDGQTPRTHSIEQPVPVIPASGGGKFGVVEPFVMPVNHGPEELRSRSVGDPLPTLTARANQYLVEAGLLGQQGGATLRPVSDPAPTIATDGAIALVEPCLIQTNERRGERVQSVDQPVRTITAAGGRCIGLVEPVIVDVAFGGGDGTRKQPSLEEPIGTLTGSNRYAVAEPVLVAMEHGGRERSVDRPLPTITTARGGAIGVAEAFVLSAGGATLRQPHSVDEPVPTVTGSDRLAVAEPVIASYYGTTNVSSVSSPLPTITAKDRFALVQPVINGMALDIRFRMLQPHELAAAMSFPKEYKFTGKREDVVRQIGNAWPGELAFALCEAIAKDYVPRRRRSRKERAA